MAEHHAPIVKDGDEINPEVHHEASDVNVRGIFWFLAIFIVTAIVLHTALWFIYVGFRKWDASHQKRPMSMMSRSRMPQTPRLQPFPSPDRGATPSTVQPPLQQFPADTKSGAVRSPLTNTPRADMDQMLAEERLLETSYGWVDRKTGVVRIPVNKAIEQALNTPNLFPVRPAGGVVPPQSVPAQGVGEAPATTSTNPASPSAAPQGSSAGTTETSTQ